MSKSGPKFSSGQNNSVYRSSFPIGLKGGGIGEFETKESAQRGAEDLKRRFPTPQIKVFDAAAQRSVDVVLA